jgi:hypothetical protein
MVLESKNTRRQSILAKNIFKKHYINIQMLLVPTMME